MNLGNIARVVTVAAACFAAVGSATSNTGTTNDHTQQPQYGSNSPPPAQQMDPGRALGLWRSTFGAVKIEADARNGGLQAGAVQGVWTYQRQGQEVIGLFWGNLRGNVLQFHWQEPANPPLTGEGYIVFEASGRQYSGRWWSDRRDRVGDWNGWRQAPAQGQDMGNMYGGQGYGYPQQPQQYPQQPQQYPQQPQQYPQQPQPYYPQQPQPQPYYPQQQPQQPQQPPQPTGGYYPQQPAPQPQPQPQPQAQPQPRPYY